MISLITSLYRSEKHLSSFLSYLSSFKEKLKGMEIEFKIIANDATPKEKQLLETHTSLLSIEYVPRESLYASWNRGIEQSQYETIGFWNVDDIRFPEALIDGIRLIKEGAPLVYFPFIYKRYIKVLGVNIPVKRQIIIPPEFSKEEFSRSMHCGPFFVFTKDFYKKVGPFDEQFRIAGDFEWCMRASKIEPFKKSEIVAGIFTKMEGSLSGGNNPRQHVENYVAHKRHGIEDKIRPSIDTELLKSYAIDTIKYEQK